MDVRRRHARFHRNISFPPISASVNSAYDVEKETAKD